MDYIDIDAYSKINLFLDITGKRPDGYHDLISIMQTVGLKDIIRISKTDNNYITVETDTAEIIDDKTNMAYKAAAILYEKYSLGSGVKIEIKKKIPIAAGMAGGSADGAAVLVGMNELFGLHICKEELEETGAILGSDVPFCIRKGTVLCKGVGDIMTDIKPMPDCYIAVAKPYINITTPFAYNELDKIDIRHPDINKALRAIDIHDINAIAATMSNVFEQVMVPKYKVIEELKTIMKNNGALNALMSGSGPTVFGLFDNKIKAENAVEEINETGKASITEVTEPFKSK